MSKIELRVKLSRQQWQGLYREHYRHKISVKQDLVYGGFMAGIALIIGFLVGFSFPVILFLVLAILLLLIPVLALYLMPVLKSAKKSEVEEFVLIKNKIGFKDAEYQLITEVKETTEFYLIYWDTNQFVGFYKSQIGDFGKLAEIRKLIL